MFTSLTFITVVTVVTIIYTIFVFFFVNIFKDSGANVAPTSEVYVSPNLIITKEQKDKWTQIWFTPPLPFMTQRPYNFISKPIHRYIT